MSVTYLDCTPIVNMKKSDPRELTFNEEKIQVLVRCRPVNRLESGHSTVVQCFKSKKEVLLTQKVQSTGKIRSKTFNYDHVFDSSTTQVELFEVGIKSIVDEVLMGYNCTIFAYGQTSTGKTFTMEGNRDPKTGEITDKGLIPRCISYIYSFLKSRNITDHTIKVSCLEVYKEELYDLLISEQRGDQSSEQLPLTGGESREASMSSVVSQPMMLGADKTKQELRIYEDSQKGTFVDGLEEIVVSNEEDIMEILRIASFKRKVAETDLNKRSSRSHLITSITIHIREQNLDGEELIKTGKLNLVDLAGSENIQRSGAQKAHAKEAGKINQSLLTLGRVIQALCSRQPHVPYRESKLTRLLQDSLGGHTKTCLIATISPSITNYEETLSTLDYAMKAKNIKNKPTINQKISKFQMIKDLSCDIDKLKKELQAQREKNGVYLSNEDFEEKMNLIESQRRKIDELEQTMMYKESTITDYRTRLDATNEKMMDMTHNYLNEKNSHEETLSKLDGFEKHFSSQLGILKGKSEVYIKDINSSILSKVSSGNETTLKEFLKRSDEFIQNFQIEIQKMMISVETAAKNEKKAIENIKSFNDKFQYETVDNFCKETKENVSNLTKEAIEHKNFQTNQKEIKKGLLSTFKTIQTHNHLEMVNLIATLFEQQQKKEREQFFEMMEKEITKEDLKNQQFNAEIVDKFGNKMNTEVSKFGMKVKNEFGNLQDDLIKNCFDQNNLLLNSTIPTQIEQEIKKQVQNEVNFTQIEKNQDPTIVRKLANFHDFVQNEVQNANSKSKEFEESFRQDISQSQGETSRIAEYVNEKKRSRNGGSLHHSNSLPGSSNNNANRAAASSSLGSGAPYEDDQNSRDKKKRKTAA